mmetsp:Transcript_44005/g.115614  ORF Transcript_44005/g.115614 Transcript_44005/m.115614 type:complete len:110 (-) Transcript_44005:598-927(-)
MDAPSRGAVGHVENALTAVRKSAVTTGREKQSSTSICICRCPGPTTEENPVPQHGRQYATQQEQQKCPRSPQGQQVVALPSAAQAVMLAAALAAQLAAELTAAPPLAAA